MNIDELMKKWNDRFCNKFGELLKISANKDNNKEYETVELIKEFTEDLQKLKEEEYGSLFSYLKRWKYKRKGKTPTQAGKLTKVKRDGNTKEKEKLRNLVM